MVKFYGNKVNSDLRILRASDLPDGTRPVDILGAGAMTLEAPDSERARSLLAARRSREGLE